MDNSFILFDRIQIKEDSHFESFIGDLTEEQSLYIIRLAINAALSKGLYSLEESEILSKSIRILNRTDLNQNNTGS
jgi:hypothetical protein